MSGLNASENYSGLSPLSVKQCFCFFQIRYVVFLGLLFALTTAHLHAKENSIGFLIGGEAHSQVTLSDLQQSLTPHQIEFFSPFNNKNKRYSAFPILDVLGFAFGEKLQSQEFSDIAFIALDGYQAISPLQRFSEKGGYLAYKDLDVESGWEPVGRKQANPGPFFLVWTEDHQTTANTYPWPWQIDQINLLRFQDQYPEVIPVGVDQSSRVHQGFQLFRDRCLRCHAMNQQGGKIGPDLNAPQSITAYRSKYMIIEIIKHASKYRHSQMPDHLDLSDHDLENLYRYLWHQGNS